ncbi:hypothetical protein GCM10028799_28660 [Kribbella italica]
METPTTKGFALLTSVLTGLLLTTTVAGAAAPAPIDWTETPTELGTAVLYTTERADGAQWSVGISLEQDGEALRFHPLAAYWDGKAWRRTESSVADGRLDDLLVRSRSDVWAVGATEDPENGDRALLQRWNGMAWSRVKNPVEPVAGSSQYTAVTAAGAGVLVGEAATDADGNYQTAVRRYAGGKWTALPSAGLQHIIYLDDLEQVSPQDVWAAGIGGMARYDGKAWREVKLPIDMPTDRQFEIAQLVVRAADDIWAVGEKPSEEFWRQPLALHFDGKKWTEVAAPVRTGQFHDLEFVDGRPVAVGGDPTTQEPIVAELSGNAFVETTAPPGAGYLHGSTVVGRCLWAVGVAAPGGTVEQPYAAVGTHRSSTPKACR